MLRIYNYTSTFVNDITLSMLTLVQIVDQPEVFYPEMLSDMAYTEGVAAMTKITSQMLNTIKEQHNFRS